MIKFKFGRWRLWQQEIQQACGAIWRSLDLVGVRSKQVSFMCQEYGFNRRVQPFGNLSSASVFR